MHLPAEREGVIGVGGGGGGEEVAAGGGEAGVAAAVAAERGGAGEREREGGADVLLQVREQGRRGRRHLRQPGQGRLRPRRRRAGEPAQLLLLLLVLPPRVVLGVFKTSRRFLIEICSMGNELMNT